MLQIKTYRLKLKPTKAQEQTFAQWLGTCRYVYNLALDTKIHAYKTYGVKLTKYDLIKQLPLLKDTEWINRVNAQTLQEVIERLDKAYQSFFKGGGYPKFANKAKYSSFTFKQRIKLHQNTSTITLPKIGKIKYRNSGEVKGVVKTGIISKQVDGWYISLTCEVNIEPLPVSTNTIGLDVGIKYFLVSSDEKPPVENPKYLYNYEYKLRKAQRTVSRKKKGSANRRKAIINLSKVYLKISNTRKDFQHKLSTTIIRENQTIVVEDLKVKNMVKNHHLAKSISDAAWGAFFTMLEYKSKWYGRKYVEVAPNHTSQDCSVCGERNKSLTLADREWTCGSCGTFHCRDKNAAKNIKSKGVGHTLLASQVYKSIRVVGEESPYL